MDLPPKLPQKLDLLLEALLELELWDKDLSLVELELSMEPWDIDLSLVELWDKDSDAPEGYQLATLSQARLRGWGAGSAAPAS